MNKGLFLILALAGTCLWTGSARAEETTPAPTEAAPAAADPAASAPASPAAQPAPAPAADAATGEEEKKDDKEEFTRPFAGSAVNWSNEFTAISLNKDYDPTYNPTYSMSFGVAPRWTFAKGWSLSTNIGFNTELTNSDFANKRGEVFVEDIPLKLTYSKTLPVNDDVKFQTGANLGAVAPISKMSQYTTLYTALTLGAKAGFLFPKVLSGLSIGWSPSFKKYFHESETPRAEENKLYESVPTTERATSESYLALNFSGRENPTWSFSNGLNLSLSFVESVSFTFGYTHTYIYKYEASDNYEDADNCADQPMGCDAVQDSDLGGERGIYNQMFMYDLSYTPWPLLTLSAGAVTASNQLGEDGQYRTPFFNRETVITFGLSLDIDASVDAIQTGSLTPADDK